LAKKVGPHFSQAHAIRKIFGTAGDRLFSLHSYAALPDPLRGSEVYDDPPTMPTVKVSKDQDYCGETLPNETYLIGSDGALQNVVVFETSPTGRRSTKENSNNTGSLLPRI
jgi:hypothetical protein